MSGVSKTLKWGTALTWLLGSGAAIPIVGAIVVAFVAFLAILMGAAQYVQPIYQHNYEQSNSYFQKKSQEIAPEQGGGDWGGPSAAPAN